MKKRLLCVLLSAWIILCGMPVFAAGTLTVEGPASLSTNGGTAQLRAYYNGTDVTSAVSWSISRGAAYASVNTSGLLTALGNGSVTVMAILPTEGASTNKAITITGQSNVKTAKLWARAESAGHIVRNLGEEGEENWFSMNFSDRTIGEEYRLTAVEKGCEFLYWKNDENNSIITEEPYLQFVHGAPKRIAAIFRSGTDRFLSFRDEEGFIIQNGYLINDNQYTVPYAPVKPGYNFEGWYKDGVRQPIYAGDIISSEGATEDLIYIAHYTKRGDTYTITVTGGSGSGKYRYDELVTVSLDKKAVPAGKRFAYWEKDGAIVSADEVYQFRAGRDEQITAVFTDGWPPAEKGPVLLMGQPTVSQSDRKFAFLSEWSLPLDYTLVETGILVHTTKNFSLDSDSGAVLKAVSNSQANAGRFTLTKSKSVIAGMPWYAKAYLIYQYNGKVYTLYSDLISASL